MAWPGLKRKRKMRPSASPVRDGRRSITVRRTVVSVLAVLTVLYLGACQPETGGDHFEKANVYYDRGQYERAVKSYWNYLDEYPRGSKRELALYRSGEILFYILGQKTRANEVFTLLIQQFPQGGYSRKARIILAGMFQNNTMEYPKAITLYQELIDRNPESADAPKYQFEIAQCYLLDGQVEQAVLEFGTLLRRYPLSNLVDRVYDELAGAYLALGRPDVANVILACLLNQFPDSKIRMRAEFKKGTALEELYRYNEALDVYRGLLEKYKNRRAVEIRISGILERQKNKHSKATNVDYNYRPRMSGETRRKLEAGTENTPKVKGVKTRIRATGEEQP